MIQYKKIKEIKTMNEFDYNNTIPSYEKLLTDENSMEYGVNKEINEILADIKDLEERIRKIRLDWAMQVQDRMATWDSTVEMIYQIEKTIKDAFYDIMERLD